MKNSLQNSEARSEISGGVTRHPRFSLWKLRRNGMKKLINSRFLFAVPALVFLFIFVLLPVFSVFVMSFFSWDLLSPPKFTGWDNFLRLLEDKWFWNSIWASTNSSHSHRLEADLNRGHGKNLSTSSKK